MKLEKWMKAIPESQAHGSGTLQKRLWRLTSDYCRVRDFYKYGYCVATGGKIRAWSDGQAGHFISYSVCNGVFKWDVENIHLQSAKSNSWGGMEIGHSFAEELENRGIDIAKLRARNRDTPLKVNDTLVVEKMKDILLKMKDLKEQPEYYPRVLSLLSGEW